MATFKKAITHVHTHHSVDCCVNPTKIVDRAIKLGIDYLLITDHDSLAGSIEAAHYAKKKGYSIEIPFAAEYATEIGDVIVFGVPSGFTKIKGHESLCRRAKEEGGWTILPHPFKAHKLEKVNFDWIDGIEVYNSRCSIEENLQAWELAQRLGKPMVYGSDAHTLGDLDNALFTYQGKTILDGENLPMRLVTTPWQSNEFSRCVRGIKLRKPREILRAIKRSLLFTFAPNQLTTR